MEPGGASEQTRREAEDADGDRVAPGLVSLLRDDELALPWGSAELYVRAADGVMVLVPSVALSRVGAA